MTLWGGRSGGCDEDKDLVGDAIGRDIVGCWRSLRAPQREGTTGCSAGLRPIGEKRARRGHNPDTNGSNTASPPHRHQHRWRQLRRPRSRHSQRRSPHRHQPCRLRSRSPRHRLQHRRRRHRQRRSRHRRQPRRPRSRSPRHRLQHRQHRRRRHHHPPHRHKCRLRTACLKQTGGRSRKR